MVSEPVGLVEAASPFEVRGWAFDKAQPGLALDLVLRVDGFACDWFRPALRMPAIADHLGWPRDKLGLTAFQRNLPAWVADGKPHRVEVMHAGTGEILKPGVQTVQHTVSQRPVPSPLPVSVPVPVPAAAKQQHLQQHLQQNLQHHVPKAALKPRLRPSAPSQVTVVVLNRNGSAVLGPLLQSWCRYNTVACDWIVVDHGSTDDSLSVLAGWQKQLNINVVALDHNDSFSASCNRAVAMAHTPYVLFLNNDIVWLQDALGPMLQTLQDDPTIGAVGLKLLKATPGPQGFSTVQHLGVRYCLSGDSYWPFEATPDDHECEFAPQAVPAVTAAVMVCRRADLNAVGGFDEQYFYGFEDVDLCLRLQHQLGKHIVCRNDLVALHRHGHTRLTGREGSQQFDRIAHNARVLGQHSGLWAKQSWWHSLLTGDRLLCVEPLKIGLLASGRAASVAPSTLRLGQRLQTQLPHAQVLLVQPAEKATNFDVRGIHVLLVDAPTYDIRTLHNARPDLMLVALVNSRPNSWVAQPWWLSYSAYLCNTARSAQALQALSPVHIHTTTAAQPMGQLLQPDALPLRVGIDWPVGFKDAAHLASQLQISFKQSGLACWLLPQDPGPAGRRVLDARVMLWPHATPAKAPAPAEATVNVLWSPSVGTAKTRASTKAKTQANSNSTATATAKTNKRQPPGHRWVHIHQAPTAALLRQHWKAQIEHTFSAP